MWERDDEPTCRWGIRQHLGGYFMLAAIATAPVLADGIYMGGGILGTILLVLLIVYLAKRV